LEDNLMRLFASDRIAKWMDRMGFKEGEVLEHSMLNKSVERAQKKVEENNFGIRKRLLEYDDVMNKQREVVYERRRHALMGERIDIDILNMLYEVSIAVVEQYYDSPDYDYDDLKIELLRIMAVEAPFEERAFKSERMQNLSEQIYEKAIQSFKVKMDRLAEIANPVIKNVYETQGDKYQNILVPVSDGKRIYNISCDLKEAYDTGAKGVIKSFEKSILLHTIDEQWKEHLREMDDLRQSVQNASYEQKDPLLIYKLESFNLFKTMVDTINKKAVAILMRAQIPVRQAEDVRQAAPESKTDYSRYRTEKSELPGQNPNPQRGGQIPPQGEKPKPMPIRVDKKPGRNDPCYCGSGKKYKNCHGRLEE
jgi:preprotein translocase subunit SecA